MVCDDHLDFDAVVKKAWCTDCYPQIQQQAATSTLQATIKMQEAADGDEYAVGQEYSPLLGQWGRKFNNDREMKAIVSAIRTREQPFTPLQLIQMVMTRFAEIMAEIDEAQSREQ